MDSLTCVLVFEELPGELGAIQERIFNTAEFSPLIADQLSPGQRAQVDLVHDHSASLELPHFNSVFSPLVFTRSHVLLDAAHGRTHRGIDLPRLFVPPVHVKAAARGEPREAEACGLAVEHLAASHCWTADLNGEPNPRGRGRPFCCVGTASPIGDPFE